MRKNTIILWSLILAAALGLAACSSDNTYSPEDDQPAKSSITISIPASAPTTRAAGDIRPLYSSNAWQEVHNLRVYFYFSTTENGTYEPAVIRDGRSYIDLSDLFKKNTTWQDEKKGHESHSFDIWNLDTRQGYYKLMAVADEGGTRPRQSYSWEQNPAEAFSSHKITLNSASAPLTSETFIGFPGAPAAAKAAGYDSGNDNCATPARFAQTYYVEKAGEPITATIELRRAVSGLVLYIENIPAKHKFGGVDYNVQSLAVVPAHLVDNFNLDDYTTQATAPNNLSTIAQGNGAICTYDLSYCWDNEIAHVADGIFINTSSNPKHPNSILTGNFIAPTVVSGKTADQFFGTYSPLYLVFFGKKADGTDETIKCVGQKRIKLKSGASETDHYYLLPNHFYMIGHNRVPDPAHPEDPGEDEPYDLYEGGEIILVCGNWQANIDIEF